MHHTIVKAVWQELAASQGWLSCSRSLQRHQQTALLTALNLVRLPPCATAAAHRTTPPHTRVTRWSCSGWWQQNWAGRRAGTGTSAARIGRPCWRTCSAQMEHAPCQLQVCAGRYVLPGWLGPAWHQPAAAALRSCWAQAWSGLPAAHDDCSPKMAPAVYGGDLEGQQRVSMIACSAVFASRQQAHSCLYAHQVTCCLHTSTAADPACGTLRLPLLLPYANSRGGELGELGVGHQVQLANLQVRLQGADCKRGADGR